MKLNINSNLNKTKQFNDLFIYFFYFVCTPQAGDKQKIDNGDWLQNWNRGVDEQPPKLVSTTNIDKYRNMIFNVVYSLRREWKFERASDGDEDGEEKKKTTGYSIRLKRLGANSLFSREILYSLLVTNVLSLLLGAGFG